MVSSKKTKKTHESINNRLALVMKRDIYTASNKCLATRKSQHPVKLQLAEEGQTRPIKPDAELLM
ncbi:60S ribosomal protein L30 [Bienertia sinuspersici]